MTHIRATLPASLTPDTMAKVHEYMLKARRHVKTQIKLGVEATSEAQNAILIGDSKAGQAKGERCPNAFGGVDWKTSVGIFLDVKRMGEASSVPHLRMPSIKDGRISKLVGSFLQSRRVTNELQAGDLFFLFDGMRHHNENALLFGFKTPDGTSIPKHKRTLTMVYSESSLMQRLERHRGFGPLHQTESLHMIGSEPMKYVKRDRMHFEGSNKGQVLSPITAPDWQADEVWKLSVKEKKLLFGKVGRIAVGGPAPGGAADGVEEADEAGGNCRTRTGDTLEPVFFHAQPIEVDEELVHCFPLSAIIDLTGASPGLCMVAIRNRIPLFAFCFTTEHQNFLTERLERIVFEAMLVEGDKLYEPGLKELMKGSVEVIADDDDNGEGEESGEDEGQEDEGEDEGQEDEGEDEEDSGGGDEGVPTTPQSKAKAKAKATPTPKAKAKAKGKAKAKAKAKAEPSVGAAGAAELLAQKLNALHRSRT
jgi:hypothetical protein